MDKLEFGEELLKGFHTQFAENQRTREQSFLKIIGLLGAVVLGYAYVYQNLSKEIYAFSFVELASALLLLSGAFVVIVIAYNFRRDQYVNARIRKQAKVIGKKEAFPEEFDPSHIYKEENEKEKDRLLFWMPDIFVAFFLIFPVFQLLILISYCIKLEISLDFSHPDCGVTTTIIVSIICFALNFYILRKYSKKLKNRILKWEKERNDTAT